MQAMTVRTTETTATFRHPFVLASVEKPQPAGTYRLVMDEEEIAGLSFLAFRRIATMLHVPAMATTGQPSQVFLVDPDELAAALRADERT